MTTITRSNFTISQPRLVGARDSAVDLFAPLPATGVGTVRLETGYMEAASQSFADETVVQVLVQRDTELLRVSAPTERFSTHLQESAQRRGVADRLEVTPRR